MGRSLKQKAEPLQRVRCAVYCRKSNTEGLDGDFSSLDAQRDACLSYIQSQAGLGWVLIPEEYADGGFSGGNLDRPALKRLLADVEQGRIDCIVLYKLDRLSRSLIDFAKIVEILEVHGASFVSVTESFSTATPTGRLHLHMILAFAQYERELAAERIRDKIAGAKKRGKHTGGMPALGYDTDRAAKRLVVNEVEAKLVRQIFQRFCALGSATKVAAELNHEGRRTKSWTTLKGSVSGGRPWTKVHVYDVLNNRKYIGEVEHKGAVYPGEHEAIVPRALWDEVHRVLAEHHRARANKARARTSALLKGIIRCAPCQRGMMPTWTRKRGRTYRYYRCGGAAMNGHGTCPVRSIAAGQIEAAVVGQLRAVFRTPELVARTFREAKSRESEEVERLRREKGELEERLRLLRDTAAKLINTNGNGGSMVAEELRRTAGEMDAAKERLAAIDEGLRALNVHVLTERDVIDALERLDGVWQELFPAEQARIVGLLVERVDVHAEGLEVRLRAEGLRSLVAEVGSKDGREQEAAR